MEETSNSVIVKCIFDKFEAILHDIWLFF